jgi:hypothetical protein
MRELRLRELKSNAVVKEEKLRSGVGRLTDITPQSLMVGSRDCVGELHNCLDSGTHILFLTYTHTLSHTHTHIHTQWEVVY